MLHFRTIMASVGLLLVFGCGSSTYEDRLKETNALFEYHLGLDRVLQPGKWSSPNTISMRIPQGFTEIPAPPPPKPNEPVPEDSRQPFYLGLTLPGLVGAWHHRTGRPHATIHAELVRACGGPPAALADAVTLQRRVVTIRTWAVGRG